MSYKLWVINYKLGTGRYCAIGLFMLLFSFASYAQTKDTIMPIAPGMRDTSIHIIETPQVTATMQKVQEYQRLSQGKFQGYRIQIHFGQDRTAAGQVKNDFAIKFPGITSYMVYQQPYFKISVGDFRTKLDAVRALNQVKKVYHGAFVVKEKINPPYIQ